MESHLSPWDVILRERFDYHQTTVGCLKGLEIEGFLLISSWNSGSPFLCHKKERNMLDISLDQKESSLGIENICARQHSFIRSVRLICSWTKIVGLRWHCKFKKIIFWTKIVGLSCHCNCKKIIFKRKNNIQRILWTSFYRCCHAYFDSTFCWIQLLCSHSIPSWRAYRRRLCGAIDLANDLLSTTATKKRVRLS